jgi:hypothetical protein
MLPKITTAVGVDATVTLSPENEHFLVQKPPILLCAHAYKAETIDA